jgi:hypothetical protein
LNSLAGGFAKLVASPLQFIDFKGLKKMTEPWVTRLKVVGLSVRLMWQYRRTVNAWLAQVGFKIRATLSF